MYKCLPYKYVNCHLKSIVEGDCIKKEIGPQKGHWIDKTENEWWMFDDNVLNDLISYSKRAWMAVASKGYLKRSIAWYRE